MLSRLRLWAAASPVGFSALTTACGLGGFSVVLTQLWLTGVLSRLGDATAQIVSITLCYLVIATVAGTAVTMWVQRRNLGWLTRTELPTAADGQRILRLPWVMAALSGAIWIPGIVLEAVLLATLAPGRDMIAGVALVTLGALASTGFTYLVIDRLLRPTIPMIADVVRSAAHPTSTVLVRVTVTWLLASGLPLGSMILVLSDASSIPNERIRAAIYIAIASLFTGAFATVALSRSVASPLRVLRRAVRRITAGDLDVVVPVDSTSEIGLLETSVNDMTERLRERERLRDLFGRHVGAGVADRALNAGADLTGDLREATALFVDVVGSTELAHRLAPREFVDKLNRLLTIVVDATEANGGLVNKFEGDAALCIFGAPIELDDDAGSALRAARRIRDSVLALGELDIGVGVARGTVFAGDIGSDTRLEYTVIGDPVNEAARLTDAAKTVRQRILVSQKVIDAADADERDLWTPHGVLRLRGREHDTKSWTDNRGSSSGYGAKSERSSSTVETGLSQTNPRQT
ncbi:adenylate/guanylate cyclase domain-containing protein [Antrihabitans cavernicola]|uniref:Adenylate/guanylate cyclase domain-containing protein n=1 Tax=Antrihabitans cavernicola TaxID=2495913 RepID=A0A5A7SGS1_9NOCA|nr:adenylate/guanylate cyclase domain-containing protein [Spelaeibacter cavernicola]KAA0023907.1 adenylate/guanylate cyclase domain-containing protein [Spelaeibacter cavernicola]